MTRMSDHHRRQRGDTTRNHWGFLHGSLLARGVHRLVPPVPILFGLLLVGCVIPPSLSVDSQDAGTNSPPAILAVRSDQQELPEPGPVVFDQGPTAGKLSLQLIDTDVNDTLFVRVFVDYRVDDPTAPRSTCKAAGGATAPAMRTTNCDTTAVCTMADIGQTRNMTVVVFDREPLEAGVPAFQAMPEGGLTTNKFFFLKCKEGST
jgi:hypothetical protein